MSTTKIEWTRGEDGTPGKVWNPVRGCTPVSEGCRNCYAAKFAHRFNIPGGRYEGLTELTESGPKWNGKVREVQEMLHRPLEWKKPRRIFVNSMGDLFHQDVSDEFIGAVFGVMAACPQHTFQVLTKRPDRMKEWFGWVEEASKGRHTMPSIIHHAACAVDKYSRKYSDRLNQAIGSLSFAKTSKGWPLHNVWIGTSVENQKMADKRIRDLLACPAAVHWVSLEPLLGWIDLASWYLPCPYKAMEDTSEQCSKCWASHQDAEPYCTRPPFLDWAVVGGESGHAGRPVDPSWVRSIRDQCQAAGVPFMFKQWGEWKPHVGAEEVAKVEGYQLGHVIDMPMPSAGRNHTMEVAGKKYAFRGTGSSWMRRTGKKAAGRELDGRIWDEYPCQQNVTRP